MGALINIKVVIRMVGSSLDIGMGNGRWLLIFLSFSCHFEIVK